MQERVSTIPCLSLLFLMPRRCIKYSPVLWPFFSFSLLLHGTVSNFLPCCHTCWAHPFILRFLWDQSRIKLPVFYFGQEFQSPFLSQVPRILPGSPRISSCRREEAEKTPIPTALLPSISLHLCMHPLDFQWKKISFAPFSFPTDCERLPRGLGGVKG